MTKEKTYVTTDNDNFNDSFGFFMAKGQVKPLPEELNPYIERALEEGLLREATSEEVEAHLKEEQYEQDVRDGKAKPRISKTFNETIKQKKETEKSEKDLKN